MAEQQPDPAVTAVAPPGGSATAVSSAAVEKQRVITHEQASDLPETNWLWRRVFAFSVVGLLLYIVDWIVRHTMDIGILRMVAQDSLRLIGLAMLLYMAGASAEAITRLVGAVRTTRKETVTEKPAGDAP